MHYEFSQKSNKFCYRLKRFGKEKTLFFKGFRARKRAVLKADDKYIVPVKNGVLTSNKTAGADKRRKFTTFYHFKARKDIEMMRNRLYTKDEVLQVVEAALNTLDNTEAPIQEPEHLDNEIPQKSSPVNAKVTLTVPEAAELIGICKPTMYEMVRAGKVRSVKVGKKILISRQSLMDLFQEQARSA